MRLVSLCPSNTELVVYTGLKDHLVGVDDYSDWPASINELPRLGPDLSIDMNKVEALKPDLVLASLTVPGMEKNIEALKKFKLPYVIVPNPTSLSEIGQQLLWLGEKTDNEKLAAKVYEKFNQCFDEYKELCKKVTTLKSIYWEWWGKPVFTPGKDNWLTEISELAGGKNLFADHDQASVQTNWDEVYKRDPDVMAIIWVGVNHHRVQPKLIEKRPKWESLTAMKNNQLYILEEPLFCRPSPRLLVGLMKIAAILHPDIYPSFKEGYDPILSEV
ncbi:cobalamin-binding protein [Salipaludibacillus keqinensis]|uniref:Cobalamin-binding protein n=1 Tax=Salipaludibacillus keqinensis TaxID=2045207 RepID=A0A323TN86_9BACI|nr:cobalamin-binding protein [Salipaludibacillus keqinensis]PYZ95147.1 cobalamin-binding protein [Salipaludibacillus keqinensis]